MSCKTMTSNEVIHIFFASDENFFQHLTVAIMSILANANESDNFNFYVLDDNISEKSKRRILKLRKIKDFEIEFIKVNNDLFSACPQSEFCPQITYQTYYRYIIPKIKPNLDKVLYLDCDVVILKSLRELWDTNINDKYCAAVQGLKDKSRFYRDADRLGLKNTFNAGVMLLNNKKLKQDNICDLLFKNTKKLHDENNLQLQDQDALNYTFQEKVVWLNPKYNYQQTGQCNCFCSTFSKQDLLNAQKEAVIVHYNSGSKPWNSATTFFRKEYFYYLKFSGICCRNYAYILKAIKEMFYSVNKTSTHKQVKICGLKINIARGNILQKFYQRCLSIKCLRRYIDKLFFYNRGLYNNDIKDALLVYEYVAKGSNYYCPDKINIGDYIQSLAARQYIREPIQYIDRDSISTYQREPVNIILNGWYYFYEGNSTIPDSFNPLFLAFHINNTEQVDKSTLNSLKKFEPIGCRDYNTRNFLISNGIKAYFSSCLTTTLDIKYKKDNVERKGVIFCDYKIEGDNDINRALQKILSVYSKEDIEYTKHSYSKDELKTYEECFSCAETLIDKYSKAKLVITTRIHCALPCLALGTPVILIMNNYDKKRFQGIDQFFNIIGYYNKNNKLSLLNRVIFNSQKEVCNSDKYKMYSDSLKKSIEKWKQEA